MIMIYSHRNGESEIPTVQGLYWVKTSVQDSHFEYYGIEIDENGIWVNPGVDEYIERAEQMAQRTRCQWWGPIPTPWENEP